MCCWLVGQLRIYLVRCNLGGELTLNLTLTHIPPTLTPKDPGEHFQEKDPGEHLQEVQSSQASMQTDPNLHKFSNWKLLVKPHLEPGVSVYLCDFFGDGGVSQDPVSKTTHKSFCTVS